MTAGTDGTHDRPTDRPTAEFGLVPMRRGTRVSESGRSGSGSGSDPALETFLSELPRDGDVCRASTDGLPHALGDRLITEAPARPERLLRCGFSHFHGRKHVPPPPPPSSSSSSSSSGVHPSLRTVCERTATFHSGRSVSGSKPPPPPSNVDESHKNGERGRGGVVTV